MGQLLIGGHGGARLKYNLFVQPEEPDVKNGLWIQTPEAVPVLDVLLKNSYVLENQISADADNTFINCTGNPTINTSAYDDYIQSEDFFYKAEAINYTINIYKVHAVTGTKELYDSITRSSTFGASEALIFRKGILYVATQSLTGINAAGTQLYDAFVGKPVYNLNTGTAITPEITSNYSLCDINSFGYFHCDSSGDSIIKKIDYATDTISQEAGPQNILQYGTPTYQCVYNNKLLLVFDDRGAGHSPVNTFTLFMFDPDTKIISLYATVNYTNGSGNHRSYKWIAYGNLLYFFSNSSFDKTNNWGFINLDTKNAYSSPTGMGHYAMQILKSNSRIILFLGTTSGTYPSYVYTQTVTKQLSLTNSVQPDNTLLLQAGSTYEMRVLGIDKMLSKMKPYSANIQNSTYFRRLTDFSISDAWYYDTDFRKYPTYIGNGTTWNKIKN